MPSVSLETKPDLVCTKCGRRAAFLTPIGPFCPTDALLSAAFHNWIPTQIRRGFESGYESSAADGDT